MIWLQKNRDLVIILGALLITVPAPMSLVPLRALTVWPMDYSIVALDVETGEQIWEARPDQLDFPLMCLKEEVIEAVWSGSDYRGAKTLIERKTGKIIGSSEGKIGSPCLGRPALEMTRPMTTTSDGGVIDWNENGISYTKDNVTSQLRRFSGNAGQINVVRNLAIFYWSSHPGEVYALDTSSGEVVWRFEGWRLLQPDRWEERSIYLFVIGNRLFVFYSTNLFCLEITSGRVMWQKEVHLPTPRLSGEGVDPLVWPVGESFLAVYYDWLYLFDGDGDLVWEYDAEMFGGALPLLAGDRLYVASRPHARRELLKEIIPSN